MRTGLVVAAVVVMLALAVPTMAVAGASGGEDVSNVVELSPHDGPNGKYATIVDGELRVDFEGLNERATTTADGVFDVTSTADEQIEVWVAVDEDAITPYEGDDPTATLDRDSVAELDPGETLTVGFSIDTHDEVSEDGTVTIGVRYPADDADDDDDSDEDDRGTVVEPAPPIEPEPDPDPDRVVRDDRVDVEVIFDEEIDPDDVAIDRIDELPGDSEPAPPRVAIERGAVLSGLEDDGLAVHDDRLVTMEGETAWLTGSASSVYGTPGVAREPRALSVVSIVPPEELREGPATVRMTVDREVFDGGDPRAAQVGRHTSEGWQLLPTRVTEETSTSVTLEARTTGFSVFALFAATDVEYEWSLPDGTTLETDGIEATFGTAGVYDVELAVTDAEGRSDTVVRELIVNDEPSVSIEGADNVTADEETTLETNVTNAVGDATVTWTLPDGSTVTGEQVTGTFASGDRLSVTVEDEFGATGTAEATIEPVAPVDQRPFPGLQSVPLSLPLWVQLLAAVGAVGIAAGVARSETVRVAGAGGLRAARRVLGAVQDESPRIEAFSDPRWKPREGVVEIDRVEVVAPGGLLRTVDIEIADADGEVIVRKAIDVGAEASYVAAPERIPVPGGLALSEDAAYRMTVRAVDENEAVGMLERSRETLFEPGTDRV